MGNGVTGQVAVIRTELGNLVTYSLFSGTDVDGAGLWNVGLHRRVGIVRSFCNLFRIFQRLTCSLYIQYYLLCSHNNSTTESVKTKCNFVHKEEGKKLPEYRIYLVVGLELTDLVIGRKFQ